MKVTRREFTGHLVLAGSGLMLAGCPAKDVFTELETWVPVAIATFDGIVQAVDSTLITIGVSVDAAWEILRRAIDDYTHTINPGQTRLDKVIFGLELVMSRLPDVVAALPPGTAPNVLTAAKLGLALLIATLKDIRSRIQPAPKPMMAVEKAASTLPATAPAKDTKDFINRINAIMADNNVELRVK